MSISAEELRGHMNGMFATSDTALDGYKYAEAVLKAEGVSSIAVLTALLVYSNSLLEHLAKEAEEDE
tara:strand:+ start:480 stop:680 length:201 start_codon:yes stop_codon:yes gene_type:complete